MHWLTARDQAQTVSTTCAIRPGCRSFSAQHSSKLQTVQLKGRQPSLSTKPSCYICRGAFYCLLKRLIETRSCGDFCNTFLLGESVCACCLIAVRTKVFRWKINFLWRYNIWQSRSLKVTLLLEHNLLFWLICFHISSCFNTYTYLMQKHLGKWHRHVGDSKQVAQSKSLTRIFMCVNCRPIESKMATSSFQWMM